MDDVARHPDDEVLFDLAAGALDNERAEGVRAHLQRCSACAAFVEAARIGADATTLLAERVPEPVAAAMDVAIAAAWQEQHAVPAHAEPVLPRPEPVRAPRARRSRRLVPILAFAMLALLAGTSVYVGRHGQDNRASTSSESIAGGSTAAPAAPAVADTATTGSAQGVLEPAPAPTDQANDVAKATEAARSGPDVVHAQPQECLATRDQSQLQLPDGRAAQLIIAGPLGIYVICG